MSEPAQELPEGDLYPEVHLCISCLAENLPTFNFCHDCGAPIDFCAATVPFQEEWALGWIYRAAVAQPNWSSMIWMSLVFGSQLLYGCVTVFGCLMGRGFLLSELGWVALPMGLIWIGVGLAGMQRLAINSCWDDPIEEV